MFLTLNLQVSAAASRGSWFSSIHLQTQHSLYNLEAEWTHQDLDHYIFAIFFCISCMCVKGHREGGSHSVRVDIAALVRSRLSDGVLQTGGCCWDEYYWLCWCLWGWWDVISIRAAQQDTTQESSVWFIMTNCSPNVFESAKCRNRVILGDFFLYKSSGYNLKFGDLAWTQLQWQK